MTVRIGGGKTTMKTLNIPEETKRKIVMFFLETSIPRLLRRKDKESEVS